MDNLKKLRLEKGLTQQSLAEKLNIGQQSVYKYEHHITEPDIDMQKTIADFFDVSVDYLIGHSSCPHKIEEVHPTDLNHTELALLQKYRSLPPSSREVFLQLLDEFLKNNTS
ncbi:MAG: helix-turn-helix transcriptional regulator [Lachnospiraceae bacterium]|nr:helix-turn-helix transcriptional regulator [Lachnospiraceae bacterium]